MSTTCRSEKVDREVDVADSATMAHAVRTDLPPPLSSPPSTSELQRLLIGLRAMAGGRSTGAPLPPAPVLQRRIWGAPGSTPPSLVRPFILAALNEHRS